MYMAGIWYLHAYVASQLVGHGAYLQPGCGDLRFAFLLAMLSCLLANLCTMLVGKEGDVDCAQAAHTPLLEGRGSVWKVLRQNQVLLSAYLVTLLAWLGWISLQMYQTEGIHVHFRPWEHRNPCEIKGNAATSTYFPTIFRMAKGPPS